MPFSTRTVQKALRSKLRFKEDRGRSHPQFVLWHDGRIIATTHISHGSSNKEISDGVIGAMAKQLGVTGRQFRDVVSCAVTREQFLRLILEDG